MRIKFLLILLLPILLLNCTRTPEQVLSEITALEETISANPGSAQSQIGELLEKYEEYTAFSEVDLNKKVDYLLRAGEMAVLVNQPDKSLEYYEKILSEYPEHAKAATAMFMKAYTLDDKLEKYDEAKTVYEAFLQQYPNNDFADDTQFLLENLGKSEEEIIKLFESKAQADSIEQ